ncbi:4-hydroxy-tetrahydrodipicolinate synthase [hydrothermal vent metagenome]|uniref:4-hydroxy-tetrahydrodipicolinate synthase n=1 Tax=hydrothermal vent metagenome TaxID=652676 RepID=A0A3B0YPS6_9ZZZZ
MFHGSMVALVTPMREDGAVDQDSLEALIEFHIAEGSDAIVAVGTTGESATIDEREHCELLRQFVDIAAGRIPVIAGTGANSTREAIDLTRCGMQAGADACLLVTPYYNKPTQEGLYQHYKLIAESVPVPQILYNVPGRTVCDMLPETVARLAPIANIVGIKDATGSLERGRQLLDVCGDQLDIFSGDDATAMELILLGAKGDISVTANVAPRAMHAMCTAALAGDRAAAESFDRPLQSLHQDLFAQSSPIPVKWALHEMGLIPPGIRLPLTPLEPEYHDRVRVAMQQAGVVIATDA